MTVVRIPREPLTRRQRLALTCSPERLGVALAVTFVIGAIVAVALLIFGPRWIGVEFLAVTVAAGALLGIGGEAERRHMVEIAPTEGLAIHVQNGVKAWRALPPLLRAETLPVLRGLYDAGVTASLDPADAALRKRVVDRVLLLQRIGQVHERTDEVARRQAAAQARGVLDDADLADGDYTLTVLQEGLRSLGADDAALAELDAPELDKMAKAQAAAIKRADGHERHARYHGAGLPGCEHCR